MHHITVQRRRRTILGNSAICLACWPPSSNASMVRHHAVRWLSLISPKYSTCRCTVRPLPTRRFSTTLQSDAPYRPCGGSCGAKTCREAFVAVCRLQATWWHRRRLRQITAPLIPAFQSLTFAAARENPRNQGSVAKVGLNTMGQTHFVLSNTWAEHFARMHAQAGEGCCRRSSGALLAARRKCPASAHTRTQRRQWAR